MVEAASLFPKSPMVIRPVSFKFGQLRINYFSHRNKLGVLEFCMSYIWTPDKGFPVSVLIPVNWFFMLDTFSPLLNEFCSRHGFLGLQTILVCLSRCVHLWHLGDTGELGRHWIKTDTFWSCLCQDKSKRHSEYLGGSHNLYENRYRRVNLFRSQPLV